jgi:hypothetical protein
MQFSHHSVDKQSRQANEEKKDTDDNFPRWKIGAQDPKWFSDSLLALANTTGCGRLSQVNTHKSRSQKAFP